MAGKLKSRLVGGGGSGFQFQSPVSPIGSLLEGFAKGFAQSTKSTQEAEDLKLRKERSKLEQKILDLKIREIEQKQGGLSNLTNLLTGGVPAMGPTPETEPGDAPIGNVPRPDLPNMPAGRQDIIAAMAKTPGLEDEAAKAAIAPPPFDPSKFMTGGGGAPAMAGLPLSGVNVGPSGPSYRFGEQRQALSADNQLWAKLLQKHGGDFEKARAEYNVEVQKTFGAKAQAPFDAKADPINQQTQQTFQRSGAKGSALGTLDVQSLPGYQDTQEDIAQRKRLGTLKGAVPQALADLQNTQAIVDEIKGLSDRLITAEDSIGAAKQAITLTGQAFAKTKGTGELASAYQDKKKAFTGVLSRTIGGEKGVLTDRDIDRIVQSLAGFRDTKAIKDFKNKSLQRIVDVAVDAKKAIIEGREPDPLLRKSLDTLIQNLEGPSAPSSGSTTSGAPPKILSITPVQ